MHLDGSRRPIMSAHVAPADLGLTSDSPVRAGSTHPPPARARDVHVRGARARGPLRPLASSIAACSALSKNGLETCSKIGNPTVLVANFGTSVPPKSKGQWVRRS